MGGPKRQGQYQVKPDTAFESVSVTILGHYILDLLGSTPQTLVYRVRSESGQVSVLKTHRTPHATPKWVARIRHEHSILERLEQVDGIAHTHGILHHGARYGLLIADCGASALRTLMDDNVLDTREQFRIAIEVARILGDVHAHGIVHKDVNPHNIVYNPQTRVPYLIDFGHASHVRQQRASQRVRTHIEGTLAYLAPEQTGRINRAVDYRADYYALGIMLYEILVGQRPFSSKDSLELVHAHVARMPEAPHLVRPDIPKELSQAVMRLIAKAPEERYQSSHGLIHDLEYLLNHSWPTDAAMPLPLYRSPTASTVFDIGRFDIPDRPQIPERLYGREDQMQALRQAFARIASGPSELVLVTGPSGIGKSSLVYELSPSMADKEAYLASGKFDQLERATPYSALIEALSGLVRHILSEPEARLTAWRERLDRALGDAGQVIADAIPPVAHVIGPRPPVADLPPDEAQARFEQLFLRFIRTCATAERPLVLFLDDLQWADQASLSTLALILGDVACRHLLIVGAYRDRELPPRHPLSTTLESIRQLGTPVTNLTLSPLDAESIARLIGDTFAVTPGRARELAELCLELTHGNPLTLREFILSLCENRLICLDIPAPEEEKPPQWVWDIGEVRQSPLPHRVAELITTRLGRIDPEARRALSYAACIGARFQFRLLADLLSEEPTQVAAYLLEAAQAGLIHGDIERLTQYRWLSSDGDRHGDQKGIISHAHLRVPRRRRTSIASLSTAEDREDIEISFRHDRIQQAAYGQIPADHRARLHLQIGHFLHARYGDVPEDAHLFAIVDHLDRGRDHIEGHSERFTFARLNLQAGRKALVANAHVAALKYLSLGIEMLDDELWQQNPKVAISLHISRARAALMAGQRDLSKRDVELALCHCSDLDKRLELLQIQVLELVLAGSYARSVELACSALTELGIHVPPAAELIAAVAMQESELRNLLQGRDIADLAALPAADTPIVDRLIAIIRQVAPVVFLLNHHLWYWFAIFMLRLCIERGSGVQACHAYGGYSLYLVYTERYRETDTYADTALTLSRRHRIPGQLAKTASLLLSYVLHWRRPYRDCIALCSPAWDDAVAGNIPDELSYIGYVDIVHRFLGGDPLGELTARIESTSKALAEHKHKIIHGIMAKMKAAVAMLRSGSWPEDSGEHLVIAAGANAGGEFDDGDLGTDELRGKILDGPFIAAYALLILGEYDEACALYNIADKQDWRIPGALHAKSALYYDITSVILAQSAGAGSDGASTGHTVIDGDEDLAGVQAIRARIPRYQLWADNCPENYQPLVLLLSAELAWSDADYWGATRYFRQAMEQARTYGIIQEEAFICERAARFWLSQHDPDIGTHYLKKARACYAAWGAKAKVQALEAELPTRVPRGKGGGQHHSERKLPGSATLLQDTVSYTASAYGQFGDRLDLASILKASQAISSNLDLDELLERLLAISVESAGADRAVLVLFREDQGRIAATYDSNADEPFHSLGVELEKADSVIPLSIAQYVYRSGETVVVDDLETPSRWAQDVYFSRQPAGSATGSAARSAARSVARSVAGSAAKSAVCTPIQSQSRTIAVIYLENRLAAHTFSPSRQRLLNLLSAQAAVSLDNAQLYEALKSLNAQLERRVEERTRQLRSTQERLIAQAHHAGMAEVAIDILHNVGNLLNSVGVSAQLMQRELKTSALDNYGRANAILREHHGDLADFLTQNPKGQKLISYYFALEGTLKAEHVNMAENLDNIITQIDAIHAVVQSQQDYAEELGKREDLGLVDIVEEALALRGPAMAKASILIDRQYRVKPTGRILRTKLIHTLLALLQNAEEALADRQEVAVAVSAGSTVTNPTINPTQPRIIDIELDQTTADSIIRVRDNGIGVAPEHLGCVFRSGFTTKTQRLGLGLHGAANYVQQMGGQISLHSDGIGKGTSVEIRLPRLDE